MVKPMYTLVMIHHHVERIVQNNELVIPKCQHLPSGKNHTEKKIAKKPWSKMFWEKPNFGAVDLSQPFDSKNHYLLKCHHFFWFSFLHLLVNLQFQDHQQRYLEKTVFNSAGGFLRLNFKTKIQVFFPSFI